MSEKIILLAVLYFIMWGFSQKVFMFQRTIRKIATKYNLQQHLLNILYQKKHKRYYQFSQLRWVVLVIMLFVNWKIALVVYAVSFLAKVFWPEQDDFVNMQIMLDDLERNAKGIDVDILNVIRSMLGDILDELEPEGGWGMIGRKLWIHCNDDLVMGEVVNIKSSYKAYNKIPYVVIFEKEISIKNSWPQKEHLLYKKDIEDIISWKLSGTTIHIHS